MARVLDARRPATPASAPGAAARLLATAIAAPRVALAIVATSVAMLANAAPALATPGLTTRESTSAAGGEANSASAVTDAPSVSADGLVTAFASRAGNLVPNDTNGGQFNSLEGEDVFVRDRTTGTIERVAVAVDGGNADGRSNSPSLAANAPRYVAFTSAATNLVAGDTNGVADIFVRDRQEGTTVRVSVADDGSQVTEASSTRAPSISADGRFVAFESGAANLVPGDTNALTDIFVHDRDADGDGVFDEAGAGATALTRVSVSDDEAQAEGLFGFSVNAAISATGRYVAFQSRASNLVAGDTNNRADVFVRDRQENTTTRVSLTDAGGQAALVNDPVGFLQSGDTLAISGDGTQVAFASTADNLVAGDTNNAPDVYVRDLTAGRTIRLSSGRAGRPSLSFDGRFALFVSFGFPSQVHVRDRDADGNGVFDEDAGGATATTVESVASDGTVANGSSDYGAISADGSRVAFVSSATNLVPADTNAQGDVFVHRRFTPAGTRSLGVSKAGDGAGTVTSSPAGISCGTDCFSDLPVDTDVTLTADPAAGSEFTGFAGGDCIAGATTCTVRLTEATSVIATFDRIRHVLTVARAGDGQGTVTSAPGGIDCGADCTENYVQGTSVTLTARATPGSPGFTFTGFSGGGCSGSSATCTVTIDAALTVTAGFERTRRTLTVSKAGDGQGTVTSSPAGIDCGADCTQEYLDGTEVTLTASPAAAFAGFGGACTGTARCTVTMSQARSVTATFEDISTGVPPVAGPPPSPSPSPSVSPGVVAPGGGSGVVLGVDRAPAKLSVARSVVLRSARRLSVFAPISRRASGRVRVQFVAAGRRLRFSAAIVDGRIRFSRVLSRAQARLGTGILTISYAGDGDTRPQRVRLRAASGRARLALSRPQIVDGRLRASGTVSARARGVVRVQVQYVVDGQTQTRQLSAPIADGRWSLDEALSAQVRDAIARRSGTVHSYSLFTGYMPARMRGEMRSYQILGNR